MRTYGAGRCLVLRILHKHVAPNGAMICDQRRSPDFTKDIRELFRLRYKFQRNRIHAIAQSGRLGAVVEDVAEMRAAPRASNFGTLFSDAVVRFFIHILAMQYLKEAWPTGPRIELVLGAEQVQTARRARIYSGCVIVRKLSGVCAFGSLFAHDVESRWT